MRLSFLVSILVHVILLWALLNIFNVVPDIRLPKQIYNVKIFRPLKATSSESPPEEKKEPEVHVEKPEVKKPAPKPKKKPEEKKPEAKPEPEPEEEQPLDVTVGQEEATQLTVDAQRFPFSYYLTAIERRVSEHWFSSQPGRGEGIECTVYFRLDRGGRVSGLRVEESSGDPHFDRSALRAIRSAEPFPPLPRAFGESWLGIHFTFAQKR